MPQGVLAYTYEAEKINTGMTALADLPPCLDLASVLGLGDISAPMCGCGSPGGERMSS